MATRRAGQGQERVALGAGGQWRAEGRQMGCGEADAGGRRRWRRVRRGCDGHEERRRGAERCRCAEEDRDTAESGGGCGDGGRGREPQAESTGPAAGERGEEAAEYGGAGECGGSNRAVGRATYHWYGGQSWAERAADGKQYRDVVQ